MVDMRETVLPILEAGGIDVVFAGHSHAYERSYLLDGAYGYGTALTLPRPHSIPFWRTGTFWMRAMAIPPAMRPIKNIQEARLTMGRSMWWRAMGLTRPGTTRSWP